MGVQQSTTINMLVQDDEFDDLFTKYSLLKSFPRIKWLEYIVGGSEKFDGDALNAKNALAISMGYDRTIVPRLMTDGNGKIKSTDSEYEIFVNTVYTDLEPYITTDGFNIQIILTSQCAPFVDIMSKFLKSTDENEAYLSPSNVEIIVVNGKHNGKGLFKSLLELTNVCNTHNIELVIREFNAFSSMGKGAKPWVNLTDGQKFVDCGTSDKFNQRVYDAVQDDNEFAKGIVRYGLNFNSSLISKATSKIGDSVSTLNKINPDESNLWDIQNLQDDVASYIDNLIKKDGKYLTLDMKLCQRLSEDLSKIVQCANAELKRVDEDLKSELITNVQSDEYKKKLYHIKSWFKVKASITKSNMVQFPFHDLSSVLITTQSDALIPVDAWAIEFGEFMNIVKEKPDVESFPVVHYVAPDPELARNIIEELIFTAITDNL